jgi:tape measure domain-containing protein
MDQVVSKASDAVDKAESRFDAFSNVGQKLAVVGTGLTAALTVPIVGIGAAAISAAGDMEQAQIGFTTLLKSGDAASTMLNNLRDFAAKTPFQFPELVTSAQRLMALGFAANEVIPTLQSVGNATAALGAGPEVMNRIILALGQMRNSAKLSAADMKQLTEAGIKGWQYLADATGIGIKDIQDKAKDVLTGAQAAQIVLQGMAKDFAGGMEAQSKSLVGMWSNVQDTVKFALADIGKTLLPTAKSFLDGFVMPMLEGLKSLTSWFAGLPEPIKMGTLALGGILAAIGPVTAAIGALGLAIPAVSAGLAAISTALGVAVAPMAAVAAGVAGITVALVALGTWVADNWEPIRATVLQAWEGLGELWHAVWDPVAGWLSGVWNSIASVASSVWGGVTGFLGTIWAPIAPYFTGVWDAIASTLARIWTGIKSVAESVWNGVVAALDSFMSWARQIPGVNKLFTLDQAWKSAEQLAAKTKTATTEVKAHVAAHKTIAPAVKLSTDALTKHGKSAKDAEEHVRKMSKAEADHIVKVQGLKKELDKATDELLLFDAEIRSGRGPVELMTRALQGMKVEVSSLVPEFQTFSRVMDAVSADASKAADEFGAAMQRQRITSSTELKATADQAATDYARISQSGIATQGEIEQSWQAMTEAQIAYRRSIGEDVGDLEAQLATWENAHKTHRSNVQTVWGQISGDISRAFDSAALDISDSFRDLLTGDFSFKTLGDAAKDLGLNIASALLDVGARAVTDFIKDHIGALLEAIGGLLSKIPLIGDALGSVFGGAGKAIGGVAGSAGGAAGSAAGAAGGIGAGASGAASGIAGIVGMVGSVVSGIGAIGSWITGIRQEGTQNAIEHNTRYAMMYLGERSDGGILGVLFKIQEIVWYGPAAKAALELRDSFLDYRTWALAKLGEISNNTYYSLLKIDEMLNGERGIGSITVAGAQFDVASLVDAVRSAEQGIVAAIRDAADGLAQMAAPQQAQFAMVGGASINVDLRGSTIVGQNAAEQLSRTIVDRLRPVLR